MGFTSAGKTAALLGLLIGALAPLTPTPATAHGRHGSGGRHFFHHASYRHRARLPVLQCVAFAKEASDVQLSGNAVDWWDNAAGVYARGQRPEPGSVLSFQANGRMRLGHVAVVSDVVDSRTIIIDQSHWASRGISRNISVVDVSENNDWSAVRVAMGDTYGSIYPTNGFIYPRADAGHIIAAVEHAPMPRLDPAPSDLRLASRGRRNAGNRNDGDRNAFDEVAMAPAGLDLSLGADAPARNLR